MKNRGVRLLVLVIVLLAGCSSSPEETNSPSPAETTPSNPDGVIQLKPEDVKANGFQSVEVTEARVSPTLVVPARVRIRSGGESQVFSPFPGRLIVDVAIPRIGDVVAKGQHIADVEQQFAASEKLQLSA